MAARIDRVQTSGGRVEARNVGHIRAWKPGVPE